MHRPLRRRQFVETTAASAAGWLCSSSLKAASATTEAKTALGTPSPPLAEILSRADLREALSAIAESNMRLCHHCAQATFLTLQEAFGFDGYSVVKALTPMPGIAERGETCGAVTGALMAMGILFGRDRVNDWATWRACLVPARDFCKRFVLEEGSTQCGDLLHKHFGERFDLGDPSDLLKFQSSQPGPTQVCGGVVSRAASLAAEVILEERQRRLTTPP